MVLPSTTARGPAEACCGSARFAARGLLVALLGLLAPVPAVAQYEPPKQMTLSPLGVDLSDGRFSYKTTDLSIGPLTLERSFLGGHTIDGSNYFGPNWTHNYA